MAASGTLPPTTRQLRYLRALAERTGTTFSIPSSRSEASRTIEALRGRKRQPEAPWHRPGSGAAQPPTYGTVVHDAEVSGFGSSAHWQHNAPAAAQRAPAVRPESISREVSRYKLGETVRVLSVERDGDTVQLIDRAVFGQGTSYLVEPDIGMDDPASLQALAADYTRQAERLGEVPMSDRSAVPTREAAGA
jgi:hypothetical protein